MKIKRTPTLTVLVICGLLVLVSCVPQTPIPVYVTPTPQATVVPTLQAPPPAELSAVPPTVAGQNAPLQSEATVFGAVVGPEYTLQPTQTPRPTATPLPTLTPTGPTPTPLPSLTPQPIPSQTPSGPTTTPLPLLDPSRMGIQVDTNLNVNDWGDMMYYAQQTGVSWVKVQANWKFLQPNSPNDSGQEIDLFQLHVQNAKQHGFKVMISIAKAPNWARSTQDQDGPPDDPQLLANFITTLLGLVGDRTDAIEIWNEPNLTREWTGTLPFSGAGYMRLFAPAYNAIRAYSPNIQIVTAGLAPTEGPGTVDDRAYLQQMFDAGLGKYGDVAVGIHPYSWGNPPDARCCNAVDGQSWDDNPRFFFSNNIEDYHNILVKNGQGSRQMWATEFGWATWDGLPGGAPDADGWMNYNNVAEQANYTIRAFEIGQSLPYMGPMILWNLNFANQFSIGQRQEIAAYSLLIPLSNPPTFRPLYYLLGGATKPH